MRGIAASDQNDDSALTTGVMDLLRSALPFVRPLVIAGVVAALIMVGLPAFLAIASSAPVR